MSSPYPAAGSTVDLTSCDQEPIHIPGAIQPHGLLLAVSEPDLRIVQLSANSADHAMPAPASLLGRGLDTVLTPPGVAALREALAEPDPRTVSPLRLVTLPTHGARSFDGIVHRSGGLVVVELEPALADDELAFADLYPRVRGAFARLQQGARVSEMCQLATDELASLTGFDRVMAYRFDREDHGDVIAETRRPDAEPFLGLHYPASDIPAQARRLYTINWLRFIVDVGYRPAPLVASDPATAPLDLSFAVLRSVSPVHLEYLRNMGVAASMSVSLVVDGRLWGLIICHHDTPRFVPYEVRAACELLGQALSWQVASRERAERFEHRAASQALLARLIDQLAGSSDLTAALTDESEAMVRLVEATGVAVRVQGVWTRAGKTPEPTQLEALVPGLVAHLHEGVLATASLRELVPLSPLDPRVASGALALALDPEHGDLIVWFRPEVVQTVHWAGDPKKIITLTEGHARLSPRGSFALWRETVRDRSLPWELWQVEVASDLRRALIGHILRRQAELVDLTLRLSATTEALAETRDALEARLEELTRSNRELDQFAYVTSHDLKAPLRGISNLATWLEEDLGDAVTDDAREKFSTLRGRVQRLEGLINGILSYSRAGRRLTRPEVVNTRELVAEVIGLLAPPDGVSVTLGDFWPTLVAEKVPLQQVFMNLIGNAVKLVPQTGGAIRVEAAEEGDRYHFTVADNGPGIAPEFHERIWGIFQRLESRDRVEGTGVGLAVVKKIVESRGGTTWVESAKGQGATFHVLWPRHQPDDRTPASRLVPPDEPSVRAPVSGLLDPARLKALAETRLLDHPPIESLDRLTRLVSTSLEVPVSLLSLLDQHRQFFLSQQGLGEPLSVIRETPLAYSFCQHVVTGKAALILDDVRQHPTLKDTPPVEGLEVVAYAGMPIRTEEGHVIGSLCAVDSQPHPWTERELAVLRDLATTASEAISVRRRLLRAEEEKTRGLPR